MLALIIILLLLALLFGGFGFALHFLWYVALVCVIVLVVSLVVRN